MGDDLYELVQRLAGTTAFSVSAIHAAISVFEATPDEWPGEPWPEEAIAKALPLAVQGARIAGTTPAAVAAMYRQGAAVFRPLEAS